MFYTIEDINNKIDEFFSDKPEYKEEDIEKIKYDVEDILYDSIDDSYIDNACDCTKKLIDMCTEIVDKKRKKIYKDKNKLPEWIRLLVWVCIYNYLKKGDKAYKQTELLVKMGLTKDIFREKHWDMYSPDFKYRQEQYESIYLPFKHSEIEGNEIFRAMIHYMICHSTVPTDSFVDVFGKLGIIAGQCAKGYGSKQVWIPEKINVVQCFALALKKPTKVYKILKELQYKIKHSDDSKLEVERIMGRVAGELLIISKFFNIRRIDGGFSGINIYSFAARYITLLYFQPEYWIDVNYKNLRMTLEEEGIVVSGKKIESMFSNEFKLNLSMQRINKFLEGDFSDTLDKLSSLYKQKSLIFNDVDIKDILRYKNYDNIYDYADRKALLYVDVPKYIREENWSHMTKEMYSSLFSILEYHEGDWILTWKNYVEISLYGEGNEEMGKKINKYKIHTGKKKVPAMNFYDIGVNYNKELKNEMLVLYDELKKISNDRQLYILKYRDKNVSSNRPQSIVFITTIDFKNIEWEAFKGIYNIDLEFIYGSELIKQTFEEFLNDTKAWHFYKEKDTTESRIIKKLKEKPVQTMSKKNN